GGQPQDDHRLNSCILLSSLLFTSNQAMSGTDFCRQMNLHPITGVNLCKEAGGEIAMPANAEENAALMELVKTEGTFEDVSGTPVTFTNWKSGRPSNRGGHEDCSVITADGTWNDVQSYFFLTVL
uniref:C-type lectin domain-containing protein n=1 Tax=Erpetoichthys calabaricus TaxID=27687 RepID=A0A8C4X4X5_ERPCA